MRPVLCSDVVYAARALLNASYDQRETLCATLIAQAEGADWFRQRMGKTHPTWGEGTLAAAAQGHPLAASRPWNDPAFLACLRQVLDALHQRSLAEN